MTERREILYCRKCTWSAERTNRGTATHCQNPACGHHQLAYVAFLPNEHLAANSLLLREIGTSLNNVPLWEDA